MNDLPTETEIIRRNIKDLEDQRGDLETQIADLNFMIKSLLTKLYELENKRGKKNDI